MEKTSVQMALPLSPSQEAYEKLGFTFKKGGLDGNPELITATLPEGWFLERHISPVNDSHTIYDADGVPRIYSLYVYPHRRHVITSETVMYRRYRLKACKLDDSGSCEMVLFDYKTNKSIYSGGVCDHQPRFNYNLGEYFHDFPEDPECPVFWCQHYAKEHFPDWMNPEAYWQEI